MVSPPSDTGPPALTPDREARRHAVLQKYRRFYEVAAALSILLAVAGVIIGIYALHGAAQAVVLAALGGGGVLLAWMCLVIRNRLRTGPKARPEAGAGRR